MEYKQLHATVLQQRAIRLQHRIAAEQTAQGQKVLEEAQQQVAEARQQSEETAKAFAEMLRKKRKREAKEAKRQVDLSAWLPLFKVVSSALLELVAVYLKIRPTVAEMEKQGKDPGLKLFLLFEFFNAVEK